jgi:hypothetical protein
MPRAGFEENRRWSTKANDQRCGEKLIAIFYLGLVLFSPIAIAIFDRGAAARAFGVPLLYLYLFASWAMLVGMLAWVIERSAQRGGGAPSDTLRFEEGRRRDRPAR